MRFILYHTLVPAQISEEICSGEGIVCTISNNGLCASHPGGVAPPKGWTVRPLKRYVSWVQNDVNQFGLYPECALDS